MGTKATCVMGSVNSYFWARGKKQWARPWDNEDGYECRDCEKPAIGGFVQLGGGSMDCGSFKVEYLCQEHAPDEFIEEPQEHKDEVCAEIDARHDKCRRYAEDIRTKLLGAELVGVEWDLDSDVDFKGLTLTTSAGDTVHIEGHYSGTLAVNVESNS